MDSSKDYRLFLCVQSKQLPWYVKRYLCAHADFRILYMNQRLVQLKYSSSNKCRNKM